MKWVYLYLKRGRSEEGRTSPCSHSVHLPTLIKLLPAYKQGAEQDGGEERDKGRQEGRREGGAPGSGGGRGVRQQGPAAAEEAFDSGRGGVRLALGSGAQQRPRRRPVGARQRSPAAAEEAPGRRVR